MKRPRFGVGDVYALPTSHGMGYIQCSVLLSDGIALVRVLPGLYNDAPNFEVLCEQKEFNWHIFDLSSAIRFKHIKHVGLYRAPTPPKMMIQQKLKSGDYVVTYVDGTMYFADSTTVSLTIEEAQALPSFSIPTTSFIRLMLLRANGFGSELTVVEPAPKAVSHFLYFKTKANAQTVMTAINKTVDSIAFDLDKVDGERPFRMIVRDRQVPLDPNRISSDLEKAAFNVGGEYDGFELSDAF